MTITAGAAAIQQRTSQRRWDLEPGTLLLNDPSFSLPRLPGNVDSILSRIQGSLPGTARMRS